MKPIDRRSFLQRSVLGATAVSLSSREPLAGQVSTVATASHDTKAAPGIIDTNVNLFQWPFRSLKYRDTGRLVAKLRKHRIVAAWAGNFEALFAKDMNSVNEHLAAECRQHGAGFLIPFGSVNLAWPDWEEDVRRCHEIHNMPGLRIFPGYQPFALDHPAMESLVRMTTERGLVLQVAYGMEDPRVHHPIINVETVSLGPLVRVLEVVPEAKVQLLHFPASSPGGDLSRFLTFPNTVMDISRLEGNGALGRAIRSVAGLPAARVAVDRLAFGSHAPYFPLETALLKLMESPLDAPQIQAIANGNARRIYSGA